MKIALFPIARQHYLCPHQTAHSPSEKVFKMSNSMGIASAFVLSSLILSPMAMAEESHAFVAQNSARAQAYDQHQAEMMAKAKDATQTPQAATSQAQSLEKDS